MPTLHLTNVDLSRVRFAVSRTVELTLSLRVLQHDPTGLHHAWVRATRARLATRPDVDLDVLAALVPPSGFLADVPTTPASGESGDIDDELGAVARVDPALLLRDIRALREKHPRRGPGVEATLRALESDPAAGLTRLVAAMRSYWDLALAPHWAGIERVLHADIAERSEEFARQGLTAVLDRLSPRVALVDGTLHVEAHCGGAGEFTGGRGLRLTPSIFCQPRGLVALEGPAVPVVIYHALGGGTVWSAGQAAADTGLDRALGRTRAQILRAIAIPSTTTELAGLLDLSPGTVSGHLSVLRTAGLAGTHRDGRAVLYHRTPVAGDLVTRTTPGRRDLTRPAHSQQTADLPMTEVDVFGSGPLRGNGLAVVHDSEGVGEEDMRRIAGWTGFAETAFMSAPSDPRADYRLRIFTPTSEHPFAGHPTLGSARAFMHRQGLPDDAEVTLVQECAAGLVEVRSREGMLWFATPPRTRTGPLADADLLQVAAALGIDRDEIVAHAWGSNGPRWSLVQLRDADAVRALRPCADRGDLRVGVVGLEPEGASTAYEVRAFGGTYEDPVTGSLQGSIAQWLHERGLTPARYVAAQGRAMGRDGRVHVQHEGVRTWIGGRASVIVSGHLHATD